MEECSNLRLVRCPKCENLLPELPDYSVYQCGGCGAVLRAKEKTNASDALLAKSDEETAAGISEKSHGLSDKAGLNLRTATGVEMEGDGFECGRKRERLVSGLATNFTGRSSSKREERGFHTGPDEKMMLGKSSEERANECDNKLRQCSKIQIDNSLCSEDHGRGTNNSYMDRSWLERDLREITPQKRHLNESFKSSFLANQCDGEWGGLHGLDRNLNAVTEQRRFSTFAFADEGPSNHHLGTYRCGERMMNQDKPSEVTRVENLEQNRVELLRKLDELKDQLSQSCNIAEKRRERIPTDAKMPPLDPYVAKPPYFNLGQRPTPFLNYHDINIPNFCPPAGHLPNETPIYEDPYNPQMVRDPYQFSHLSSKYTDFDQNPLSSYRQAPFFHQSSCSCLYNKRYQNDQIDHKYFYHASPVNRKDYKNRGSNLKGRRRSYLNSDIDDFVHCRTKRVMVAKGNRRIFQPIAGGAPFITCYNCFNVLKLPRERFSLMKKDHYKLRCGSCSTIILLTVENNRFIVSVPKQAKRISSEVDDRSSGEALDEIRPTSHGYLNSTSEDFDNPGYNFDSTDTVANLLSKEHSPNISDYEKMELLSSASSSSNEKHLVSTGSSLQDHFNNSSSNNEISQHGKGNRSNRTDQDYVIISKTTSRQNSIKDASVPTEMDVSSNEFLNADSVVASKEDQPRNKKGSESFFAGFIKKSFKDISRSNQSSENGKHNVLVNGQLLPDRVIKKAEKLAGPIHPGEYWYDFQAGFWGVMGQPCLGIIPPFIEEFNFPMLESCAGGNTRVFVNGRELHQKDLDLLASRGLPTEREKSYIVDISGKVYDKESGEELDCLGKLAPTVEKVKHGFGMRARQVAL